MEQAHNKRYVFLIYLALAFVTLVAFEQVRHNDFVNYDDDVYITRNSHVRNGLTFESVKWAFTTDYANNWHPLTWISHMLDCQLFGLNPTWHHLVNLLFHIANTLLLFYVLKTMTAAVWPSVFVAAAFALHPLHVESVAWVAERKDVLSTLFWLLTIAAYIRYAKRPSIVGYLPVILLFALGLMAKPMLVTLPFVLILLDYWPLERFACEQQDSKNDFQKSTLPRLIAEKIPLFILVAASSVITFLGEAVISQDAIPLASRVPNAAISYMAYIGKTIWPARLAVFYPHPLDSVSIWNAIVATLLLLAISIWTIRLAKTRKYLLVGWLIYIGTLVPVIGLVQIGSQAMADRYTYLSLIGLFIMIAWGITDLTSKWRPQKIILTVSSAAVLVAMLICTRMQLRHWRNNFTLFGRALAVTENNYVMHNNFGSFLLENNRLDEALVRFDEALRINPQYISAHTNAGIVLLKQRKFDEAIRHFNEALSIGTDLPKVYNELGLAYGMQGKYELAIQNFKKALELKPDLAKASLNLQTSRKKMLKANTGNLAKPQ